MRLKNLLIPLLIALTMTTLPATGRAQRIARLSVDTVACLGDTIDVTIGYNSSHNAVVQNGITSLTHTETVFLPDGVPCGDLGCSYRSAVTFADFAPGAAISSVQDIRFVRLNLEHSFIGDIYINITCPNGQKADLMRKHTTGDNTQCSSTIPASSRGWRGPDSQNTARGTFFGEAYDQSSSGSPCNSNASANAPGIGWNYCWSNNTTSGFQYAPGDAIIYRAANASYHSGSASWSTSTFQAVDSSNVAAGSNFYHPDDNFSALVGCPLNGEWYIEVVDGYASDNGYIFEWELSLNPTLLPTERTIVARDLLGDSTIRVSDSSFRICAPHAASADTVVPYTVRVVNNIGDTIDTIFRMHYYQAVTTAVGGDYCQGQSVHYKNRLITADTSWVEHLHRARSGCDSTVVADFRFHPVYDLHDTTTFCGSRFLGFNGIREGDTTLVLRTVDGCDSTVHFSLVQLDSTFNPCPELSADGTLWTSDSLLLGCAPQNVWFRDTCPGVDSQLWLFGDDDSSAVRNPQHLYPDTGTFSVVYVASSLTGCADTIRLDRAVRLLARPVADFDWDYQLPPAHRPETQFINLSAPDSMDFLWLIPLAAGSADCDSLRDFAPFYAWSSDGGVLYGDYDIRLVATWSHLVTVGDSSYVIGCTDTATRQLTIVNDFLQFPNLVTPNADGENDVWEVVGLVDNAAYQMSELWIYNQWGALVFHERNIADHSQAWDPEATRSPDGTYFFYFTARNVNYGAVKRTGLIEVVRTR